MRRGFATRRGALGLSAVIWLIGQDYRRRHRLIASIADQGKTRIAAFCRAGL
jgi:hypothetical protein